ncbi:hypothetical protein PG994_001641 [Apiospora phragmitis]|uniref:Transposase n=1 Tax=Apiospora phragmitis TaxID=2905665 RepID=A0ABR1WU77_9PEZI
MPMSRTGFKSSAPRQVTPLESDFNTIRLISKYSMAIGFRYNCLRLTLQLFAAHVTESPDYWNTTGSRSGLGPAQRLSQRKTLRMAVVRGKTSPALQQDLRGTFFE